MCKSFVHQKLSARISSRLSTTSQAALYSGLATSHACLEPATQKAHAFVGTREEDSGRPRDGLWQISRTASEVLRARGRRRKSDHLFGMGNPGARPHGLAETRHGSAFRHLETAAAVISVRQKSIRVTPEEKRRYLAQRAQETEQRRALFNAETDAEVTEVGFQKYFTHSFHFRGGWKYCASCTLLTNLFAILTCAQRSRVHFCPQHWPLCHLGVY